MTVRRASDTIDKWIGLSTDQRPAAANIGSFFINDDNNNVYIMLKNGWTLLGSGGVGDENALLIDGSRDSVGPQHFTYDPSIDDNDSNPIPALTVGVPSVVGVNTSPTYLAINMTLEQMMQGSQFFECQANGNTVVYANADGLFVEGFLSVDNNVTLQSFAELNMVNGNLNMQGGFLHIDEYYTTPPSGATSAARIYAIDNGSGKTRLMVQFGSGTPIQLAIEA